MSSSNKGNGGDASPWGSGPPSLIHSGSGTPDIPYPPNPPNSGVTEGIVKPPEGEAVKGNIKKYSVKCEVILDSFDEGDCQPTFIWVKSLQGGLPIRPAPEPEVMRIEAVVDGLKDRKKNWMGETVEVQMIHEAVADPGIYYRVQLVYLA